MTLETIRAAKRAAAALIPGSGIRLWTLITPDNVANDLLREAHAAGIVGATTADILEDALDTALHITEQGAVVLLVHNERGGLLGAFPVAEGAAAVVLNELEARGWAAEVAAVARIHAEDWCAVCQRVRERPEQQFKPENCPGCGRLPPWIVG